MTYDALKLRDGELLDVMLATRKHNFTTMIHAENGEVVEWMTKKLEEKCMTEPYHHYTSRPPIVEAEAGGRRGGGTRLTATGADAVRLYRAIERKAGKAAAADAARLRKLLAG